MSQQREDENFAAGGDDKEANPTGRVANWTGEEQSFNVPPTLPERVAGVDLDEVDDEVLAGDEKD